MLIDFTKFSESLSTALDYAEKALLNVAPYHGMRIAVLTSYMAEHLGLSEETRYALTQAAELHDCALSEYLSDELAEGKIQKSELDMGAHCSAGERILLKLPQYQSVRGAVLYHHERADGLGAFGKTAEETPVTAQIIHMADAVDVRFSLYDYSDEKYAEIRKWVEEKAGSVFSETVAGAFLDCIDESVLKAIEKDGCRKELSKLLPPKAEEVSVEVLRDMASVFAYITDYKSHFTWRHSMGIAEKAEIMGRFYGYDEKTCGILFVTGALHDIGKLLTSNDILEKPGKLTPEEYKEIQNHALGTWDLLKDIKGLEDIARWAALHHEKLDGSGYPFGYTADKLDRNCRLLACLDIYQALVEDRPYKAGMSHADAMAILNKMSCAGQLDSEITKDIDRCFAGKEAAKAAPATETPVYRGTGPAYRCPVCGYIYEGEIPDDFICPRCEQPGTIFEKI